MSSADCAQHDTMLDRHAMPGVFGFKPTSGGHHMQQLMTRKRNLRTQAEHFASLYPDGIPSWWLKHRYNDTLILHLYRIIDQEHGSDLISPLSPPAVCQHVVQDFRGKEIQCLSLHHSSAVSSFPNQPTVLCSEEMKYTINPEPAPRSVYLGGGSRGIYLCYNEVS